MKNTSSINMNQLLQAFNTRQPITGLTHQYYKYPAMFSPLFTREIIKIFSEPGDTILDPFMGSGTVLVEAKSLSRHSVGVDISSLATFISNVKTTTYKEHELQEVISWFANIIPKMNCHASHTRPKKWIEAGYLKNMNSLEIWRIRKLIEIALNSVEYIKNKRKENLIRCIILKTSQWALDTKRQIPSANEFRKKLLENSIFITSQASKFSEIIKKNKSLYDIKSKIKSYCSNRSAKGLENEKTLHSFFPPKLIITSPPYPGVHIIYHRWQINSRKETPAPFWIANCNDGMGESVYTMGYRNQKNLKDYFDNIQNTFISLSKICDNTTLVVQLIAFSNPSWQLPKYLATMECSGFKETNIIYSFNSSDKRLWRKVPNRKWYTTQNREMNSSKEVVLFHKLSKIN